jgi:hypothetical protein
MVRKASPDSKTRGWRLLGDQAPDETVGALHDHLAIGRVGFAKMGPAWVDRRCAMRVRGPREQGAALQASFVERPTKNPLEPASDEEEVRGDDEHGFVTLAQKKGAELQRITDFRESLRPNTDT